MIVILSNVYLQQNSRIHAWIDREHLNALEEHFEEGRQIEITNLTVHLYDPSKKNICFQNNKYITLSNLTVVSPILEANNIPEHVFNFTNFQDLPTVAQQDRYLTGIKTYSHVLMFIT